MLTCPFQQCEQTFSRRPAFREHVKTHKGQAYWEILNRLSENSHNIVEDTNVEYPVENITLENEEMVNFFFRTKITNVMYLY